jgi:hypothetical protein
VRRNGRRWVAAKNEPIGAAYVSILKMEVANFLRNISTYLQDLHSIISQKTILSTVTAVRTPNLPLNPVFGVR